MTGNDKRYLEMAARVAQTSECRFRHGCVVVKNGNVLGVSPNVQRNDPKYVVWTECSVHAEMASMRRAGWPKKAILYVVRINNQGERRNSMPCENCNTLIEELQCKVVHT